MSGFEVIGVLLGVYPLVADGLKTCKALKSGQGISRLENDLNNEIDRYITFLGCILGVEFAIEARNSLDDGKSLNLSPAQRAKLQNLPQRLGKTKAGVICSTLNDSKNLLESMQDQISKALKDGGLDGGNYERVISKFRTFKIVRPQSNFRDNLKQLKACNKILKQQVASPLPQNVRKKMLPTFLNESDYGLDIYHAINNAYRCPCDIPHPARLGLPDLPKISDLLALTDKESDSFNLLFPFEEPILENDTAFLSTVQTSQTGSFQGSNDEENARETSPMKSKLSSKHVRRLSINSSTATMTTTITNASSRSNISKSRSLMVKECTETSTDQPEDICKMIREFESLTNAEQERVGMIASEKRKYELRKATIIREPDIGETLDLDDLITYYRHVMYQTYRFALALQLAYAVLQLHSTPWITPDISLKMFTTVVKRERPNIDDPLFVSHDFYSLERQAAESKVPSETSSDLWSAFGEEKLTRVGFALIELVLGKRLSEVRQDGSIRPHPRINNIDALDFWTAKEVLSEGILLQQGGEEFEDVVRVLIMHEIMDGYEKRTLRSTDSSFYRDAQQLVVVPLFNVWERSLGKRRPG